MPAALLTGLLVLLAGGGSDTTATDAGPSRAAETSTESSPTDASSVGETSAPASDAPSSATTAPAGPAGMVTYSVVRVITQTMGGGEVSPVATPVPDAHAARRFADQFGDSGLAARLARAVDRARVGPEQALYGAVVSIGCAAPTDVEVAPGADGYLIQAAGESTPGIQCLAPMTSVALVLIDV